MQRVDSSPITSTADIYCNPLWVTVEGRNSVAQPGDALFYSGKESSVGGLKVQGRAVVGLILRSR